METLKLPCDGSGKGAGMGDFDIRSSDAKVSIIIKYVGEPPHGDSYHSMSINKKPFPGYVWGGLFAFSSDSRYFVCSWMSKLIERKTIVIDCIENKYFVLPEYIHSFNIKWPLINESGETSGNKSYYFSGDEQWISY